MCSDFPRASEQGAVLFEVAWMVAFLISLLLTTQIGVIRFWNDRLTTLQQQRIRYDGAPQWKP